MLPRNGTIFDSRFLNQYICKNDITMKNTLLILLFALFSFSASAQGKKNEKAVIKTFFHCDHCKDCETCGKLFQENLHKIKGVRMHEIDAEKNTITVYYNGQKTNLDAIRQEIANLGYDADDVKATAAGYEKLDGCCKKS